MSTITATFATRAFAREAEQELKGAGFEAVSIDVHVTPEEIEAVSQPNQDNVELQGLVAANNTENITQTSIVTASVAPLVIETLEANATALLTVRTETREDEAIAIINKHGGTIENERAQIAQSTKDEVANAAQASGRLK